jgi:hypothetical protein
MKRSAVDALLSRVIDEADAGQLPVLIDEWLEVGDARHWIARALRIDLAVLVDRPELVVPCLLRRCTWLGAEFPPFAQRSAPPPDAAAVRGLARSWEASWTRPYLRSLRTPLVPLDGGVVEEYRSAAVGALWLTASHVGLGHDIAWDRTSGKRVAMAMPSPREPTWKLVRDRRQLVSAEHVVPLPIEPEHEPSQLVELDPDLVLVTASFDEGYGESYEYFTYVIDVRRGVRLASFPVDCSAAVLHGDLIYATSRGKFFAWSLSGEPPRNGDVAGDGLVLAPDGTFATRSAQVVRVYDPARVGLASFADIHTRGLVELSPDSTRALVGQVVCDARTGEQLAEIRFNGLGNWLEGGPPRNCRALCDDVIVEIMPFGYHLWDSTTGETLVDDRDHRASARDAVAFAPNGRSHAILNRGTLRVYDNHSLRVLHETTLEVAADPWGTRIKLSYDGSTLWWGGREEPLQPLELRPGRAALGAPRIAAISDGLVVLDDLALPIDDARAEVSTDGLVILGRSAHYVRV